MNPPRALANGAWLRSQDLGLLLQRGVAGGLLLPQGLGQALGWFGGAGLTAFAGELQRSGLPSAAPLPFLLAALQVLLGTLVVLGAGTRISALLAALLLAVAAAALAPSGACLGCRHGVEFPLFWCASLLALALCGGGRLSLDVWWPGGAEEDSGF